MALVGKALRLYRMKIFFFYIVLYGSLWILNLIIPDYIDLLALPNQYTTEIYFLHFWRVEVPDQGASKFGF